VKKEQGNGREINVEIELLRKSPGMLISYLLVLGFKRLLFSHGLVVIVFSLGVVWACSSAQSQRKTFPNESNSATNEHHDDSAEKENIIITEQVINDSSDEMQNGKKSSVKNNRHIGSGEQSACFNLGRVHNQQQEGIQK